MFQFWTITIHVFGEKIRFSSEAGSDHQVVAGVALQLFTLGIPCIYAGTEQALVGPETAERKWLSDWKKSDRICESHVLVLEHPRQFGVAACNPLIKTYLASAILDSRCSLF
ncbi:MAG UNVERIFIED_CONTAM: hypothetical protein LVR29_21505 [Microcystis novacekii LVE1205-3]|jgi:glycosidase